MATCTAGGKSKSSSDVLRHHDKVAVDRSLTSGDLQNESLSPQFRYRPVAAMSKPSGSHGASEEADVEVPRRQFPSFSTALQVLQTQNAMVRSVPHNRNSSTVSFNNHPQQLQNPSLSKVPAAFSKVSDIPTTSITIQPRPPTDLSKWNFPEKILNGYRRAGITQFFPWQAECLSISGGRVLNGGNLVYSAPTSAGKTLVAEILLLKRVVEIKKKGLFILPFVSLAREKMATLQRLFSDAGIRVDGFMGNLHPTGGLDLVDVAVCTIERANSLINRMVDEKQLHQLGVVVVDELHLIGDSGRGYLLELLLTKLLFLNKKRLAAAGVVDDAEVDLSKGAQIIAMSATLPNLEMVQKWLHADLYRSDFRPVPLYESVKFGPTLYDKSWKMIRHVSRIPDSTSQSDPDQIVSLCLETVQAGHSVLLFCPTKKWCEVLAEAICVEFKRISNRSKQGLEEIIVWSEYLEEIIDQLRQCPAGVDHVLRKTIPFGVAFHHAGLTMDERDIVEGGFRKCAIKVLVATTTLSAGVNLPARRVIIRSPMIYGDNGLKPLDILTYNQMAGRAGRKGVDTQGECILVCKDNAEKTAVTQIFASGMKPIASCLSFVPGQEPNATILRAVLEIVVNGAARSKEEIRTYMESALFSCGLNDADISQNVGAVIDSLCKSEFMYINPNKEEITPSLLGNAVVWSGLSPADGSLVFRELEKARCCLNLENELHILYLITPLNITYSLPDLDYYRFLQLWEHAPPAWQRVGEIVGVTDASITKGVQNKLRDQMQINVLKRFYCAMMLSELVHEIALPVVASKYDVNKGVIQSLQQGASSYSGMVTIFCEELKWEHMALLFDQFQSRLMFGVYRELVELVKIQYLSNRQARALYNGGYPNLMKLAVANRAEIAQILRASVPFESQSAERLHGDKQMVILLNGLDPLIETQAAEVIISEARRLLEADMKAHRFKITSQQSEESSTVDMVALTQTAHNSTIVEFNELQFALSPKEVVESTDETSIKRKLPDTVDDTEEKRKHLRVTEKCADGVNVPLISSFDEDDYDPDIINENEKIRIPITPEKSRDRNFIVISPTKEATDDAKRKLEISVKKGEEVLQSTQMMDSDDPVDEITVFEENLKTFSITPEEHDINVDTEQKSDISCLTEKLDKLAESNLLNEQTNEPIEKNGKKSSEHVADGGNSLAKTSSGNPVTPLDSMAVKEEVSIVDVPLTKDGLANFLKKWKKEKSFSLCLACEKLNKTRSRIAPAGAGDAANDGNGIAVRPESMDIIGISVSWNAKISSFLSLATSDQTSAASDDDTVPLQERISELKKFFKDLSPDVIVMIFDFKRQLKLLMLSMGISLSSVQCVDPKIADWMLDMDLHEKGLQMLCASRNPLALDTIKSTSDYRGCSSLGLSASLPVDARHRACNETIVTRLLMENLTFVLKEHDLWDTFVHVEMPVFRCLVSMEMNGFGFSVQESNRLQRIINDHLDYLQKKAYRLAGGPFSLTAPNDIGHVLFVKLNIEPPPEAIQNTKNSKGNRKMFYSTSKEVLEKIKNDHELPAVIMEHRTLVNAMTNYLTPIQELLAYHPSLQMQRIHGLCYPFSMTGRVSMSDPNLQTIPRGLVINKGISGATDYFIGLRSAFIPTQGALLLSADYTQLEVRILAHLSADAKLISALQNGGDVFRMIASSWKNISINDVTPDQHQQAKKICYGMIYGMGAKALADQLNVPEKDAAEFMESFKLAFPSIRRFIQSTIEKCRQKGYVETIAGNRRYLPAINSSRRDDRSAAERMTVNTTVQGSAANLAKTALVKIEAELDRVFPDRTNHHSMWKGKKNVQFKGACLVLHLHDEFIFEVNQGDLMMVAEIVKRNMENALKLLVPLEVKMKSGMSWGTMQSYELSS